MKVVLISGKARHGKDTTAAFLKEALERDGNRVLIAHYGDLVKYVCKAFFCWNGEKDERGRAMLQRVGTDVIRARDEDFWTRFLCSILSFFPDEWDFVLIPDCRFPNEVDAPGEFGLDSTHLRVIRPDFDNGLTEEQQNHISETALDDVRADSYLYNDGDLNDLRKKATDWVVSFTGYNQISFVEP